MWSQLANAMTMTPVCPYIYISQPIGTWNFCLGHVHKEPYSERDLLQGWLGLVLTVKNV
jgi:hypothetical protein